ncbi:MAG: LamG domain-containing protein [Candidatus Cloacimonetes bacterium]|nr:LamG domain-containing protein [Candidatus Cloacimonadota bacterium]
MRTLLVVCILLLFMIDVTHSYAFENSDRSTGNNRSLVAYYPFYGDYNDHSGSALHLTVEGYPQLCTDRHGNANQAYQFDGMLDYFWVDDAPILRPENFTICAWFCAEFKTGYTRILEKRYRVPAAPYSSYLLEVTDDSSLPKAQAAINSSQRIIQAQQGVAHDTWHQLCATYDGSSFKLYLDGELSSSMNVTGLVNYSEFPLCIGNAYPGAPQNHNFKGKLDDLRIYNHALSENEIRNMFDLVTMPRNVSIACISGQPLLSWDDQEAASSFSVYSASDCLAEFPDEWVLEESGITGTQWQDDSPQASCKFYRVVAVDD